MTPRKRVSASSRRRSAAPRKKAPSRRKAGTSAAIKTGRPNYYTAEFLAEARRRVEHTFQSMTSLAADLGMHHSVLCRLIKRKRWVRPEGARYRRGLTPVMRLAAAADALVHAASPPPESGRSASEASRVGVTAAKAPQTPTLTLPLSGGGNPTAPAAPAPPDASAIDRLEAAVLKELTTVETMRASLGTEPLRPMDAERTARTLSTLTETLAKLRRLRLGAQPQPETTDDDILDIDAFRLNLARRIEAFLESREVDGGAQRDPGAAAVGAA